MSKKSKLTSVNVTPKDGMIEIILSATDGAHHYLVPASAAKAIAVLLIQSLTVVDAPPAQSLNS